MLVIGLMSGTSLDGIDAAIVRFEPGSTDPDWSLVAFRSTPYTESQRDEIDHAILRGGAASICRLNARLGEWFASAALDVCRVAGIDARDIALIGSHGQTIWHEPPSPGQRGATLQLGCAATIAERTRIAVVSDFRSRDVAAGGHGAPLVPWADRMLFAAPDRDRVLVNVGGMANLSRVPRRGSGDALLAFDTGPGNAPIDGVVSEATDGRQTFDAGGARAAAGTVDPGLLDELLRHPFLDLAPPRSTGREQFGRPFVNELLARVQPRTESQWNDLIATVTTFVARSIADAIRRWVAPRGVDEVIITGGGASNPHLMRLLAGDLNPVPVRSGRDVGIEVDAKEAIAFAALAWAHVMKLPGNVPEATGAHGPRLLGALTPA
ncbi:MAG: anhydro-N-acetylmuramic acid kinase [Longimicrobiales bacterium]